MVFFTLLLLLPVYTVIREGLNVSMLLEVFRNPIYVEGLLNSTLIAVTSTAMVFLISLPLAWLYDRFDFPGKGICNLAVMAPMILPPFVGALGFQQLLGHYGVLNALLGHLGMGPIDFLGGEGRFWAVCFIEALHLYPIVYLNLVAALANLDPALEEAGCNLGIGRWMRFRKITLPLIRPGLFAGGSIVLIWSFTELGTPLMFGYNRITSVQIFNGLAELESNPLPYALVLVMLLVSVVLYWGSRKLIAGETHSTLTKGIAGSSARKLTSWRKILPLAGFALITLLAVAPHVALIFISCSKSWYGTVFPEGVTLEYFRQALSDKLVVPSIINSIRYSVLAMLLAVAAGVLTAWVTVRWKLKGSWILDLLSMLPLAVPGIVMAFGFMGMSIKYEWARFLFDPVANPLLLLSAAYAVRRLPYVARSVAAGLQQTPEELESAARNLGAGAFLTVRKIVFPLILANIIVGGLFAFSFSMLEVSDSLILAQKSEFYPITKAIFELSQVLGSGPFVACAFGVWAMLFLGATLGAAGAVLGRKLGAIFRF